MQTFEPLKIYHSVGKYVVHIPAYRGEELFLYLANHGIESRVSRLKTAPLDRLEMDEDLNVQALRTTLDQWRVLGTMRGPHERPIRTTFSAELPAELSR